MALFTLICPDNTRKRFSTKDDAVAAAARYCAENGLIFFELLQCDSAQFGPENGMLVIYATFIDKIGTVKAGNGMHDDVRIFVVSPSA